MKTERNWERCALRRKSLKLRAGVAFWSAVSAAINVYLAVISLGRRGRRHG